MFLYRETLLARNVAFEILTCGLAWIPGRARYEAEYNIERYGLQDAHFHVSTDFFVYEPRNPQPSTLNPNP